MLPPPQSPTLCPGLVPGGRSRPGSTRRGQRIPAPFHPDRRPLLWAVASAGGPQWPTPPLAAQSPYPLGSRAAIDSRSNPAKALLHENRHRPSLQTAAGPISPLSTQVPEGRGSFSFSSLLFIPLRTAHLCSCCVSAATPWDRSPTGGSGLLYHGTFRLSTPQLPATVRGRGRCQKRRRAREKREYL